MNTTAFNAPICEKQHYSVASIENGTVIDHIPAGKAIFLLRLLKLDSHLSQVTIGMNLPSPQMTSKDIIKVEKWELPSHVTSKIAIFAPRATINIIQNYQVVDKYIVSIPSSIEHCIICPNAQCITNHEKTNRNFVILAYRKEIHLQCGFCEKVFSQNEITQYCL